MSKQEAQEAAFISSGLEPINIIIDKNTSKRLGFLRMDLLNPQIDGLALLQGNKIFTMQLKNKYFISKIEYSFEF